ncbi:hypothetical protein PBI_GRETELLYN_50 [Gordonia phage GretelLyn]|uniref:Uncharacterized protein n=2 Tax=Lambovirus sadboi TaxID=2844674 RepID=A0A5J6TEN0_9CAUD|nr:hypothetical protein HWC71_gp51 [Gordonia phage Sadboi]QFG08189.1 hypothetical protein PBI_GRETELLYN_50 [Gordonia phage GretelLyn]QFG14701.1 hypothetical protein PBI_SADBOI_51 [Gordonia phage Sadboi]
MNIDFNHESYRPPNNESVSTIRVFNVHGVETQRLEDTGVAGLYALCQSFLGIAKTWGWQLHPDMAEALEGNLAGLQVKSWPIGTAQQWETGALGTVQFVGKFKQ